MDIYQTASLKTFDEFVAQYQPGDELELHDGRSLVWAAVSNTKPDEGHRIANFLLDRDAPIDGRGPDGAGIFEVLFSRKSKDLDSLIALARRLLERGADPNVVDDDGHSALHSIRLMPFLDDALVPLYDFWFSIPGLTTIDLVDDFGHTPISISEKMGNRPRFVAAMEAYRAGH